MASTVFLSQASFLSVASTGGSVYARKPAESFLKQKSLFLGGDLVSQSQSSSRHSIQKPPGRLRITATAETKQAGSGGGGIMAQFTDFFQGILRSINRGQKEQAQEEEPEGLGTGKTILVAGATGKMGRFIVKKLLEKGHKVVALVASTERAEKILVEELGLAVGRNPEGGELVTAVGDILDEATVRSALQGCDAVISAVGSRFSPDGYRPGSSPEEVYGKGLPLLIRASRDALEATGTVSQTEELAIFDYSSVTPSSSETEAPPATNGAVRAGNDGTKIGVPTVVDGWYVLDDVIMGGISDGALQKGQGSVIFQGTLRSEGGGFSSIRTAIPGGPLDLSAYDGITLRVKGDGQRYKVGWRSQAEFKGPPNVAMFDTIRGQWTTVTVPFNQFKAVDQSNIVPDAPPVDTKSIYSVQILATLFQFNKEPNPLTTPGPFRLEVASIGAYRSPRPQFVLVSSAAVERSARAVTPELREVSIPIVRLNPGGILTWKLQAEAILRASGLTYTVVRPCGLTEKDQDQPFLLEVSQGDAITGLLSREEAAAVCVEALESPGTANTTFEVRRDDLTKGIAMSDWPGLFQRLRPDLRPGTVLTAPPLPEKTATPPAPPTAAAASEKA